jgi:hypothetical protein
LGHDCLGYLKPNLILQDGPRKIFPPAAAAPQLPAAQLPNTKTIAASQLAPPAQTVCPRKIMEIFNKAGGQNKVSLGWKETWRYQRSLVCSPPSLIRTPVIYGTAAGCNLVMLPRRKYCSTSTFLPWVVHIARMDFTHGPCALAAHHPQL